jgi:transposase
VTLQRLWLEYLERQPAGYRYSQFCLHYHRWARTLASTMRQVHRAGEKVFVDFSGKKPSIIDVATGELTPVELFVGALGASSYVYAEACPSRNCPRGSRPTCGWWSTSAARRGPSASHTNAPRRRRCVAAVRRIASGSAKA